MEKQKNLPDLRFHEFSEVWEWHKLKDLFLLISGQHLNPEDYTTVPNNLIPYFTGPSDFTNLENNVTKWALINGKDAVKGDILFTVKGSGLGTMMYLHLPKVTIGRQLMAIRSERALTSLLYFYLGTQKQYYESLGKGNMIPGLSRFDLLDTSICFPTLKEQTKIATFLTAVDERLNQLKKKKTLLEQYKKGVIQKIFDQEIRFKDDDGNEFPDWVEKTLKEVLIEHKIRNSKYEINEVFSVAKKKGVINQIEHLGRSYASSETSNYKVVFPNDIIYTKSPTSDFPFGIIKQNKLGRSGIVSVLYAVFTPENKYIGLLLDYYFSNWKNTYNYLNPLVQKGAKNTMNISNEAFLNGAELCLPSSGKEQSKIANFLSAIDEKINCCTYLISKTEQYKKGLLQQMFV